MKAKAALSLGIILLFLIGDQALKLWIKTTMAIGDSIYITDWFQLYFIENEGMAFGLKWGGAYGKLFLSLFRIFAVGVIGIFLTQLIRKKGSSIGLIISMSLIIAGAIGNILDSAFYGLLFSESSTRDIATFLPEAGGYAKFLHGHVVDMLYFPLYNQNLPDWVPFIGGSHVHFFRPIFNIADAAISLGVLSIILFHRHFFNEFDEQKASEKIASSETSNTLAPS